MKDGAKAYESLLGLYRVFSRENLMTVSPAGIAGAESDIFSFDANEAAVSGMSEMLLQSYDGFIEFLPAIPDSWDKGEVKGICAQGGLVIDMKWAQKRLSNAEIKATREHVFRYICLRNGVCRYLKSMERKLMPMPIKSCMTSLCQTVTYCR